MKIYTLLLLLVVFTSQNAEAKTWYVEKDGTGDYTIIQDAVDAAASGDTVRIGVGRFNDLSMASCTGLSYPARVIFNKEELTLIGSGPEETIIGQEEFWDTSQGRQYGIVVGHCGNLKYRISNLKIENSFYGILDAPLGLQGEVKNSVFSGHAYGLIIYSDDVEVNNCVFRSPTEYYSSPTHCLSFGDNSLLVTESQFHSLSIVGQRVKNFLNMSSADVVVNDCSFDGGGIGVWSTGRQTSVHSCSFSSLTRFGVGSNGSDINVTDSYFSNVAVGIEESDGMGHLQIERCEFVNMETATFSSSGAATGFFHDCILDKGERYVAVMRPFDKKQEKQSEYPNFDMTDNWWGTSDPDSIQAWVLDFNDYPDHPWRPIIDFVPYKSAPVSVKKSSLGNFKSMFR